MSQSREKLVDKPDNLITATKKVLGARWNIKLLLVLVAPAIAVFALYSQARCAVVMDGEVVAVASGREVAESAVNLCLERLEESTGLPPGVDKQIVYRPTWRLAVDNHDKIQQLLAARLNSLYGATGIFVDGEMIAAVKDKSTGQEVLDRILHIYDNDGQWQVSFKQKVELKPVPAGEVKLMSIEEAVDHVRFGGKGVRTYEVKEGDTLWDIAVATKIPVDELICSNPGMNPDRLQLGQVIKISRTKPLIDVVATYNDTRQEEILYRVQEKVDDNLFYGERKVVQKGKPGLREVVYHVTAENGVEIEKKVVREKILEEPVHQVVAKGTRKLLASRGGNGRLAYPTTGGIVSPFGNRGGRPHLGVDIAASHGSPVVAAEAGTVLSVGYQGGYGLRVDISHGGGVVTRYAHLSSAAVKAGQIVERGQFIGRAGSTGNATGPHLHFEVIVDGVHKDPALFI